MRLFRISFFCVSFTHALLLVLMQLASTRSVHAGMELGLSGGAAFTFVAPGSGLTWSGGADTCYLFPKGALPFSIGPGLIFFSVGTGPSYLLAPELVVLVSDGRLSVAAIMGWASQFNDSGLGTGFRVGVRMPIRPGFYIGPEVGYVSLRFSSTTVATVFGTVGVRMQF